MFVGPPDIATARKLLGSDKIIGISTNTVDEAITACEQGADYLGIGTVFSTQTKKNLKGIIGPEGTRHILLALSAKGHAHVPTVCIGGINASNTPQVLFRGSPPEKPLDGIAVVSAIMAARDPEAASRQLLGLVRGSGALRSRTMSALKAATAAPGTKEDVLRLVPAAIKAVHEQKPLSHNMTNLVVQNFAANVALAVGASPIMANYGEEAADLAKLGGALVINMGTVTPEGLQNYEKALRAYNAAGRPVIFDPVGAGATAVRRAAVKSILSAGYIDVIKGNESEIKTVFGSGGDDVEGQRGVDSSSTLSREERARMVRALAAREEAVVVMTGKTDLVSDGARTVAIDNGHEYLGAITGTGCTLGTTISAMVAAASSPSSSSSSSGGGDRLAAVVAGILLFEIAAEQAAGKSSVEGPGTFVPAFLDSLYRIRTGTAGGDVGWLAAEKLSWL